MEYRPGSAAVGLAWLTHPAATDTLDRDRNQGGRTDALDVRRVRPAVAMAAAASALCLVSLALAARSEAYVYWVIDHLDHPRRYGLDCARPNLDGSGVDQGFISDAVGGPPLGGFAVAVDAEHIYWTDPDAQTIGRANLDGSDVDRSFITGASFRLRPEGVAVDASYIYWTNAAIDTIGRANLDGTGVNRRFVTGASDPGGVAVDAGHVYWD